MRGGPVRPGSPAANKAAPWCPSSTPAGWKPPTGHRWLVIATKINWFRRAASAPTWSLAGRSLLSDAMSAAHPFHISSTDLPVALHLRHEDQPRLAASFGLAC